MREGVSRVRLDEILHVQVMTAPHEPSVIIHYRLSEERLPHELVPDFLVWLEGALADEVLSHDLRGSLPGETWFDRET